MKAITLTPPWGTLVAIGAKRIETRSWSTDYRGLLAIHQAKGLNGLRVPGEPWTPQWELRNRLARLCDSDPFFTVLRPHLAGYTAAERAADLPRGSIVAVARLTDVLPTSNFTFAQPIAGEHEDAFGDFTPGRYAWLLAGVLNFRAGVDCKGGRGLWDVPAEIVDELASYDDGINE